ncbi:hypothetical protein ACJD0Z_10555 [Flavobacteriaceae bacterium M23B6Z8]
MNISKLNSKSVKSIGKFENSSTVSLQEMNKLMGGGAYCDCDTNARLACAGGSFAAH